jgi:hypothetical protein
MLTAIIASVNLLYFAIVLLASVLLIRSTKRRDHSNMKLFMKLMAIGIVFSLLQIIYDTTFTGIVLAILITGLDLYVFICIYSLYDLFRNERLGRNGQVHVQTQVMPGYPNQQPVMYVQQPQMPYVANQQHQFMQQPPTFVQQQQPPPSSSQEPQLAAAIATATVISGISETAETPRKVIL